MEKYFAAKRLLFDGTMYPAPRVAVLNAHDERTPAAGRSRTRAPAPKSAPTASASGDWRAASHTLTPGGATIQLETPAGSAQVTSRLAGEVNILNLLAAFTAAHARGVSFESSRRIRPTSRLLSPGASSPSMQASPSPSSSTTRTPTTRSATSSRSPASSPQNPVAASLHCLRLRRRSRPHQAPQNGPSRG